MLFYTDNGIKAERNHKRESLIEVPKQIGMTKYTSFKKNWQDNF